MISSACGMRRSLCRSAPGVPCTQWSGQSTCVPYGSWVVSNGFLPGWDDANDTWPGVCQSCVSTTCSKAGARRLMIGMIWSPSFTAREPPGVKQFCTSTTRRTSCAVSFIFVPPVCAAAIRAAPASPATARLAAVPLRNPRRSLVSIVVPPSTLCALQAVARLGPRRPRRADESRRDSATIRRSTSSALVASPVGVRAGQQALDERPHLVAVPLARAHDHARHLAARPDDERGRERRHAPGIRRLRVRVQEDRERELQVAHVRLEEVSRGAAIHRDGEHEEPALLIAAPQ